LHWHLQRQRKCQCARDAEGVEGRERARSVLPDPGAPAIRMLWTKPRQFQLCRPPDPAVLSRQRRKKCVLSPRATLQHCNTYTMSAV
jgi:hypothetical protein